MQGRAGLEADVWPDYKARSLGLSPLSPSPSLDYTESELVSLVLGQLILICLICRNV